MSPAPLMVKHATSVERLHKLAADTAETYNQEAHPVTYTVEYLLGIAAQFYATISKRGTAEL